MEPISIYIRISMCVKKCAYCDFTSFCGRMMQREAYTEAVCREMREQAAFFARAAGGDGVFRRGNAHADDGRADRAHDDTGWSCFALAADAEITMEGNPGTLTRKNLDAYRAAGVNRLSLGVQSLDDGLLRNIGRIHTSEEAKAAVAMARAAGFDNLNLDLMLGLPGRSRNSGNRRSKKAMARRRNT